MKLNTLSDLYVTELRDIFNAENQLLKALPQMSQAASSPELRSALEQHLQVTQNQVDRLETIFTNLGQKPGGERCEAMEGLVTEGRELIEIDAQDDVRDAGIIVSAQKIEHYEIATYGSLQTFAKILGRLEDATLLRETLDEEKEADTMLTEIAERVVNKQAMS